MAKTSVFDTIWSTWKVRKGKNQSLPWWAVICVSGTYLSSSARKLPGSSWLGPAELGWNLSPALSTHPHPVLLSWFGSIFALAPVDKLEKPLHHTSLSSLLHGDRGAWLLQQVIVGDEWGELVGSSVGLK